ncbi:8073_t:CDS:2 [Paraglomus brasilianum]|uniref:8073_t:CDS:1 n=1 Tax=Paraglomus brasilianum TaxID=144538 RepID=A0A9N9DAT5_9GLOM|nr:8073_t:CDS:2 [Paraglomus brasilianum]
MSSDIHRLTGSTVLADRKHMSNISLETECLDNFEEYLPQKPRSSSTHIERVISRLLHVLVYSMKATAPIIVVVGSAPTGLETDTDTGVGADPDTTVDLGAETGVSAGTETDVGAGAETDVGTGAGEGTEAVDVETGVSVDANAGVVPSAVVATSRAGIGAIGTGAGVVLESD